MSTGSFAGTDLPAAQAVPDDKSALGEMILRMRMHGLRNNAILSALETTPRKLFLRAEDHRVAYQDMGLPIECGQTVLAPSLIARMIDALSLTREHKVLEVGTGSGYQCAVLSRLAKAVYSVERYRGLIELAEQRLKTLKTDNVYIRHGDGLKGYADKAPFDRIIVTGAVTEIPPALLDQIKFGGLMVIAVGPADGPQNLMRIERTGSRFIEQVVTEVRLVHLQPGAAQAL